MNASYESRDNNIVRASVSVYARERALSKYTASERARARARGHVVKYSRALMPARALYEGARYRDYIFRVHGKRRNCPGFVFYDAREILCPRPRSGCHRSADRAAFPPRNRCHFVTADGEDFSIRRGEGTA